MKSVVMSAQDFGPDVGALFNRRGVQVKVVDAKSRPGGLISSQRIHHGLVETAENGLLADTGVQEHFAN